MGKNNLNTNIDNTTKQTIADSKHSFIQIYYIDTR